MIVFARLIAASRFVFCSAASWRSISRRAVSSSAMRSCFQFSFFFRMASSVFGQFLTLSSLRALSRSRRVSVAVGASGRV